MTIIGLPILNYWTTCFSSYCESYWKLYSRTASGQLLNILFSNSLKEFVQQASRHPGPRRVDLQRGDCEDFSRQVRTPASLRVFRPKRNPRFVYGPFPKRHWFVYGPFPKKSSICLWIFSNKTSICSWTLSKTVLDLVMDLFQKASDFVYRPLSKKVLNLCMDLFRKLHDFFMDHWFLLLPECGVGVDFCWLRRLGQKEQGVV